jgi:hypothetical protein
MPRGLVVLASASTAGWGLVAAMVDCYDGGRLVMQDVDRGRKRFDCEGVCMSERRARERGQRYLNCVASS